MKEIKSRYPSTQNGKKIIEIKIGSIKQLFDERDPTPFIEKDLDDDAVEYIVSCVQEISPKKAGILRVITTDLIDQSSNYIVEKAVKDFFIYKVSLSNKKLRTTLKNGFKSLLIGLSFFSFAVLVSKSITLQLPSGFYGEFVKEGLLLMGWVSMWKPINIFLYEWWPLLELKKVYLTLVNIQFELENPNKTLKHVRKHGV